MIETSGHRVRVEVTDPTGNVIVHNLDHPAPTRRELRTVQTVADAAKYAGLSRGQLIAWLAADLHDVETYERVAGDRGWLA